MPYIGRSTDGFGVRNRFLYLASANDTSVSGADANGATLTFTDGAYVDVYLNGVLLKAGTDYNTNTANTIASLAAMAANDEVTVVVYDVFTVGDMVSATSGGTFVGNVAMSGTLGVTGATTTAAITASGVIKTDDTTDSTSTTTGSIQTDGGVGIAKDLVVGDDILLKSDSAAIKFGADSEITLTHDADQGLTIKHASSADNKFPLLTLAAGDNDISANDVLGQIRWIAPDEGTGTDAVTMAGNIQVVSEGDFAADNNAVYMSFATGSSGAATDKLFLDSNGFVGIGTSTPSVYNSYGNGFIVKKAGAGASHSGMSIISATDGYGSIYFNDGTGNNTTGAIDYNHSTNIMRIRAGGATAIQINGGSGCEVTMPLQPAFMAFVASTTFNLANGSAQTLNFQTEQFDQNADFANNTTFTAPVAGKYMLTASIRLDSLQSNTNYAYLGFQTSNRNIVFWLSAPQDWNGGTYYTANGAVLCNMDANDTAYVYFYGQGGTDQADHTDGYFSGYLVA